MDIAIHERIVCLIAAEVRNHGVVVMGSFTPLAYASYMLAKLTHAPEMILVGYDAIDMPALHLSYLGSEASAYAGATARLDALSEVNSIHLSNRGMVEAISPAQLDGTGAFNLSAIGNYAQPSVRLPGAAGAPEVVQMYERVVAYFTNHSLRNLVKRVDFASGSRWQVGAERRRQAGLLEGPVTVVTNLAVLRKDEDDSPFKLVSVHPGVAPQTVVANTGFELSVGESTPTTADPEPHYIRLLRERVDPYETAKIDMLAGAERRAHMRSILQTEWNRARSTVLARRARAAGLAQQ